jgi:hypothetical protein
MRGVRRPLLVLALMATVAACAAHAPTKSEWVKIDPAAEDLEHARAACKKEAYEASKDVPRAGYANDQALAAFIACMRQHGWARQAR